MKKLSKSAVAVTVILLSFTVCKRNIAPDKPTTPSGPSFGNINVSYQFSSTATDPDGDSIAIRFSWGDGDTSNWSPLVLSGDTVKMNHSYQALRTFEIIAQAKDKAGLFSNWSFPHSIIIPKPPCTLWTKTFGQTGSETGHCVQQTSDRGYIIAGSRSGSGVYLIKTDENGNLQWEKTFGGRGYYGYSLDQTSDGGYIIAGFTDSNETGYYDVYLLKTDGNGNLLWDKTLGGAYDDYGYSVGQTSDGGYIIAGKTEDEEGDLDIYLIKIAPDGNLDWQKTFGGATNDVAYSVQQTSDGGYIIAGKTVFYFRGEYYEVYLIKTDKDGNLQWQKTFGGEDEDYAYSVEQTDDGGYIIVGMTDSYGARSYDVYLIKTDPDGNVQWQKTFGGADVDCGYSVQQTSDGGYIIAGFSQSFGAGDDDLYLIRTDRFGNIIWEQTFGGTGEEWGNSVCQTSDGGFIITGHTTSFGAGGHDVYLIKTLSEGDTVLR
ncbi:MAG: PQQ-binding-like beta-propeller repeat protein [candidate division WOR-3 bacterium]